MAEVAWAFHFQPSELRSMRWSELMFWHQSAVRIQKQIGGKK